MYHAKFCTVVQVLREYKFLEYTDCLCHYMTVNPGFTLWDRLCFIILLVTLPLHSWVVFWLNCTITTHALSTNRLIVYYSQI